MSTQMQDIIEQLDQEIAQEQADLNRRWEDLKVKKAYLDSLSILQEKGVVASIQVIQNQIRRPRVENSSQESPQHIRGVGDFILNHLAIHPKAETKEIINAWAEKVEDSPENVRNNVQNTLSRLKSSKKIKNKPNPGGRRYGSKWFLMQPEQNN